MELAELELKVRTLEAERAQARMRAGMRELEATNTAAVGRMNRNWRGFGATLMSTRGIMVSLFGVLGIRAAIRTMAEFEQTMADAGAVLQDLTEEGFANLTDAARELGKTTVFSASQAAEAIKYLGMAGFRTSQILGALPGTLDLAAASSIDMGTAADIASNVLQAFGLRAEEMGRVADVMAKTQATSNTNMYELAEAVKYAAPTLAPLGVALEDVAAAAAVMANQGVKGSMAGTGLRQMFIKLLDPSREAQRILSTHVDTLDKLNPRFTELSDILDVVAGLSTEEMIKIFGARGIVGASAIAQNLDSMKDYMIALRDAEGASKRMADIKLNTLIGDWKLLKSALQEVTLAVGEAGIQGALRNLVQSMTSTVNWLNANWNAIELTAVGTMLDIEEAWVKMIAGLKRGWASLQLAYDAALPAMEFAFLSAILAMSKGFEAFIRWSSEELASFVGVIHDHFGSIPGAQASMVAQWLNKLRASLEFAKPDFQEFQDEVTKAMVLPFLESMGAVEDWDKKIAGIDEATRDRLKALAEAREAAFTPTDPGPAPIAPPLDPRIKDMEEVFKAITQRSVMAQYSVRDLIEAFREMRQAVLAPDYFVGKTEEEAQADLEMIAQYGEEIERRFAGNLVSMTEAFEFGIDGMLTKWGTFAQRTALVGETLAASLDQNITDGFMSMIDGTESVGAAFKKMADAIIQDLIRVMIQQLIVRTIMQSFGGVFGAVSGTATAGGTDFWAASGEWTGPVSNEALIYHRGGVAGMGSDSRSVDGNAFIGAPRYQKGGVAGDEVPSILHRGEVVFNEDQMKALQGSRLDDGRRSMQKTEIINVSDPRMIDERIAANPRAIVNVIGSNRNEVLRALNLK